VFRERLDGHGTQISRLDRRGFPYGLESSLQRREIDARSLRDQALACVLIQLLPEAEHLTLTLGTKHRADALCVRAVSIR